MAIAIGWSICSSWSGAHTWLVQPLGRDHLSTVCSWKRQVKGERFSSKISWQVILSEFSGTGPLEEIKTPASLLRERKIRLKESLHVQ